MELELHQLDMRYEKLRRHNARKERQLVASLAEKGQLLPVVVVQSAHEDKFILLDGYKRVRAIRSIRVDTVQATAWELAELEAVLLERLMRTSEAEGALEQGWLLEELNDRFGLSHAELARRFDKSQSWVSRRLALVRTLPREVQQRVQAGTFGAHAATKYLVPMARAKRDDCVRLLTALGKGKPSTRDVGVLYSIWSSGDAKTRELVVTHPSLVLQAREEAKRNKANPQQTDAERLLNDLGILISTSRRARGILSNRLLAGLVLAEHQELSRRVHQARWECDALFRQATSLLGEEMERTSSAKCTCKPNDPESEFKEVIDVGRAQTRCCC